MIWYEIIEHALQTIKVPKPIRHRQVNTVIYVIKYNRRHYKLRFNIEYRVSHIS